MLRSRQRRNRIALALIFAVTLTLFLLGSEFGARLYLAQHTFAIRYPADWPDLQQTWNQAELRLTDGGYFVFDDVHGPHVNIDNGARRTVGQPANAERTLWLFGNSALQDWYVPDNLTMASELQALLSQSGYRWRVVNLGFNAYLVSSELARLRDTAIRPGDVVVFLDGAPDAEAPHYWCDPHGTRFGNLALAQVVCDQLVVILQADERPAAKRYEQLTESALLYVESHGASFYHVFQADNPDLESHAPIQDFYGALSVRPQRLSVPPSMFIDNVHMTANGDALVADAVFDALTLI